MRDLGLRLSKHPSGKDVGLRQGQHHQGSRLNVWAADLPACLALLQHQGDDRHIITQQLGRLRLEGAVDPVECAHRHIEAVTLFLRQVRKGAKQPLQTLLQGPIGGQGHPDRGQMFLCDETQHRQEELTLVLEVEVNGALADPRLLSKHVDIGLVKPQAGKLAGRHTQNAAARRFTHLLIDNLWHGTSLRCAIWSCLCSIPRLWTTGQCHEEPSCSSLRAVLSGESLLSELLSHSMEGKLTDWSLTNH